MNGKMRIMDQLLMVCMKSYRLEARNGATVMDQKVNQPVKLVIRGIRWGEHIPDYDHSCPYQIPPL